MSALQWRGTPRHAQPGTGSGPQPRGGQAGTLHICSSAGLVFIARISFAICIYNQTSAYNGKRLRKQTSEEFPGVFNPLQHEMIKLSAHEKKHYQHWWRTWQLSHGTWLIATPSSKLKAAIKRKYRRFPHCVGCRNSSTQVMNHYTVNMDELQSFHWNSMNS